MKKIFLLACIFLTACGAQATAQAQQPARVVAAPVSTAIPSAPPNFQATIQVAQSAAEQSQQDAYNAQQAAIDARQTAVAANVAIVAITAAYESNQLEYARMTQVLDMGTATAAATAIPGTQTANANMLTASSANLTASAEQRQLVIAGMTATHAAPTQMVAAARAQNEAWAAPWISLGTGAALFGLAIFMIGLGVFAYRFNGKLKAGPEFVVPISDQIITPFVKDDKKEEVWRPALVPCTNDELIEFADAIIATGKTLAFNQWEGTPLHKRLDGLRRFFVHHEFAVEVPGKAGELMIVASGEEFLISCQENGCPPPPFLCLSQNNNHPVHAREITGKNNGGEVVLPPATKD